MDKKLIIGSVAACAAMAAAAGTKARSQESKPSKWDKMRKGMEEMPEDFPPRVMFDNIEIARMNTEKILDLLEQQHSVRDEIVDEPLVDQEPTR